jgi:hypothetical protein
MLSVTVAQLLEADCRTVEVMWIPRTRISVWYIPSIVRSVFHDHKAIAFDLLMFNLAADAASYLLMSSCTIVASWGSKDDGNIISIS